MRNCNYCQGDRDGFFSYLPKKEGKGTARIFPKRESLEVSTPHKNVVVYDIKYCPMCGRKLREV